MDVHDLAGSSTQRKARLPVNDLCVSIYSIHKGYAPRRGLLHCEIAAPKWSQTLHCINVHFGLLAN